MNHHFASKLLKYFCNGLTGGILILGAIYLVLAPKITEIGEGATVIQFLNGGGKSWLIESRGNRGNKEEGKPTIIQLSEDETSVVEVRTIDGLMKADATVSPLKDPASPFPASREEFEQTGLLVWRFKNPDDLAENEYATAEWRIGNEKMESGLNFEDVPPGQTAMVLLWTGDFMHYIREGGTGEPPDGMPYCIRYPGTRKSEVEKWGRMKVPKGWETSYGNLGSGDYLDSGWLMLQSNDKEAKTDRYFATLDLVYRFKPEPEVDEATEP